MLVALPLLLAKPAFAFRSGGDLPDFDGQQLVAFGTATIPMELSDRLPPGLDPAAVESGFQAAADTWGAPGCTKVAFTLAGTTHKAAAPGDGHNTIQWVNDWKSRGFPKDSPGITDVQYEKDSSGHWTIAEADTYLNLSFGWTTGVPTDDRRSLLAVLTHELGHVLGLLHPCELNGSDGAPKCSQSSSYQLEEMYPVYSVDQTALSDDDIAGVCFLYPPGCNEASCGDGLQCVAGTCQPLCGDVVCDANSECKKGRCVATHQDCGSAGCVGQACSTSADCGVREVCDGKVCARGGAPLGDPCASAEECFDGACADGVCARSCSAADECTSGGTCDADTGVCTDPLAPMGDACKFATDCRGGYCLVEGDHSPVCTRSCAQGEPRCPSGWECREAEGAQVCALGELTAQGGCSIAPESPDPQLPLTLALGALSIVCWRTSRRRHLRRS